MLLLQYSQSMPEDSYPARRRTTARAGFCPAFAALALAIPMRAGAQQDAQAPATPVLHPTDENPPAGTPVLLDAMTTELHRAFTSLGKAATDGEKQIAALLPQLFGERRQRGVRFSAQFGALVSSIG